MMESLNWVIVGAAREGERINAWSVLPFQCKSLYKGGKKGADVHYGCDQMGTENAPFIVDL